MVLFVVFERHLSLYKPQTKTSSPQVLGNSVFCCMFSLVLMYILFFLKWNEPRMKMIFYTGIQKNSNYLINILHCILIMTEMQYIALVLFIFFNINFCALVIIKLNVSLVYFFIWYMVFYPSPCGALPGDVWTRLRREGWGIGQSTPPPSMWPGFRSWYVSHTWVRAG